MPCKAMQCRARLVQLFGRVLDDELLAESSRASRSTFPYPSNPPNPTAKTTTKQPTQGATPASSTFPLTHPPPSFAAPSSTHPTSRTSECTLHV